MLFEFYPAIFLFEEDLSKSKNVKRIFTLANSILPNKESWIFSEALIELGATICTKKARCLACPIRSECQAFAQQKIENLPFKIKETKNRKDLSRCNDFDFWK